MRSSLEILEEIRKTLKDRGLTTESIELDNEIKASSTGSELCLRSASFLLKLQARSPDVKEVIGNLISEFIVYCNVIGLFPEKN